MHTQTVSVSPPNSWVFVMALIVGGLIGASIGGCVPLKPEPEQALWSLLNEKNYPDPDSKYTPEPPCRHPGDKYRSDDQLVGCSASNERDIAYWNSREDKYRISCRGEHKSYCNPETGMVPHCHGYGRWRFCHVHPGGDYKHHHFHDREQFASAFNKEFDWP